ncbi:serine protease SP24D-like [Anopheles maculipalpis]|uniref:serine protease SP24D-like n=1 Tax=Anopheles maculipalpis TaxID=1496333 RepID=UPI002158FE0F|nr:serine protease SP24D-like [Anopheles maculipalpis]
MVRCLVVVSLVLVASLVDTGLSASIWNRIVGGQYAEDTQIPYQIALFYNGDFRCGGSIIGARLVLTAAHCVVNGDTVLDAKRFAVHAGSANLVFGGSLFEVEAVHAHEFYGSPQNDIAVLEMKEPFQYSKYIQPIELMEEEVPLGSEVVISGYGRVASGQQASPDLLYTSMFVVNDENCHSVSPGLLCIDKEGSYGACNGDSGGPAVYDGKLVGVANFILDYCGGDYADGYAKVSYYLDWIRKFMK